MFFLLLGVIIIGCESKETKRDRFFLLGNESLESNELNRAIEYYSKALEIDPDHAFSLNNRGVAKIENGNPYEAIQDYNQAILINPNYWESIENRARAYEQVGKYKSSIEDIDLLVVNFPDSAKFLLDKGIVLTKMKEYDQAYETFLKARQLLPDNHEVQINLATVDFYRGRIDSAEIRLKSVVAKYPYSPNAYNTLNQLYLKKKEPEKALEMIEKALEIESENPYFLNNRGFTLLQIDSLEAGIKDINQSILIDPENMWAYRNKGIYFLLSGVPSSAVPYLKKASGAGQGVEDAFYYLGVAYEQSGDLKKACDSWKNGMENYEDLSVTAFREYCN